MGIGVSNPTSKFVVGGSMVWAGWTSVFLNWNTNYSIPTLYPESDGALCIGKEMTNRVYVKAIQVWTNYLTNTSDERVKENITPLSSSLQKINLLKGVKNDIKKKFISDKSISSSKQDLRKNNIGFLAQDLEKVFPELVYKSDTTDLYGVNYIGLIPVIVEALKEQSTIIENLKSQLADLQSSGKNGSGKLKSNSETDNESIFPNTIASQTLLTKLYQNAPNPFKESTTIKLEIPQTIGNAMVCIYDLNGRQLKCLSVTGRGITSVQIFGNELSAGMYHYALITDNNLIDTKTMILTE